MKITWCTINRSQIWRQLFRSLQGRIFHKTSVNNFIEIIKSQEIKHNYDKEIIPNWDCQSYFTNRKCVSFCDLKNNESKFVYLFLKPSSHNKLISWDASKIDKKPFEKIVRYLESGYPGFVPIAEIEEARFIEIVDNY